MLAPRSAGRASRHAARRAVRGHRLGPSPCLGGVEARARSRRRADVRRARACSDGECRHGGRRSADRGARRRGLTVTSIRPLAAVASEDVFIARLHQLQGSDLMNRFAGATALAAALLAMPLVTFAGAQEAAPLRLTLDESIRRGLDTSHRIAEAVARGAAAEAVGRPRAGTQSCRNWRPRRGYTRTNTSTSSAFRKPEQPAARDLPGHYGQRPDTPGSANGRL